jgi:hypothetical protein
MEAIRYLQEMPSVWRAPPGPRHHPGRRVSCPGRRPLGDLAEFRQTTAAFLQSTCPMP